MYIVTSEPPVVKTQRSCSVTEGKTLEYKRFYLLEAEFNTRSLSRGFPVSGSYSRRKFFRPDTYVEMH